LIAINSLEALLQAIDPLKNDSDIKLANIDARRKEVYGMICDFNGTQTETTSIILDEENILSLKYSDKQIHLAGNGSTKCQELLAQKTVVHALKSSSKFMVKLDFEKYIAQDYNDITKIST
jgi:tRNA A37 threonylcarbamoyladenosine modification protein TsaB